MSKNRLAKVFGRITGALHVPTREDIENEYLNRSVSLNDLEHRMREVERGRFRGF